VANPAIRHQTRLKSTVMLVCQSKYQTEVLVISTETTHVHRNGDSQMPNIVYTSQLHVSAM
jgi:hypothetical protein